MCSSGFQLKKIIILFLIQIHSPSLIQLILLEAKITFSFLKEKQTKLKEPGVM